VISIKKTTRQILYLFISSSSKGSIPASLATASGGKAG
jgi:hypothetical protein